MRREKSKQDNRLPVEELSLRLREYRGESRDGVQAPPLSEKSRKKPKLSLHCL